MRRSWLHLTTTRWHKHIASAGLACLITSPALAWQFKDVTPGEGETVAEELLDESAEGETVEPSEQGFAEETPPAIVEVTDQLQPQPTESAPMIEDTVLADGPVAEGAAPDPSSEQFAPPPTEEELADQGVDHHELIDDSTLEAEELVDEGPADAAQVAEALASQTDASSEVNEEPIRPIRFNGVVVGKTKDEGLIEAWGEPFKVSRGSDYSIYKYRMRPFRQVDATVIDNTVVSLLIHLDEPLDPTHCAEQLNIAKIDAVPIPDEFGKVLGLSYPERGVLFSFDNDDPDTLVSKISLEPISAEPFALRAMYDFELKFEKNMEDLDRAIAMDGQYAEAYWLKATKLQAVGRYRDALQATSQALNFEADNALFQLTHAELLMETGDHDNAVRQIERILAIADLPTELRAKGELLLGNLIADSARPRYKEAMEHHLAAIDLAATLASDRRFVPRRMSKDVLVEAHLAVARNISRGDYQKQTEIAPKWLSRARALVEELVSRDQGDPMLRLLVYRDILATAGDLQSVDDPSSVIDDMFAEGRRQIAAAKDSLNQSRIEWTLGEGVAEAVRLQRLRGANEVALQLSDDGLVLLQQSAKKRQSTPMQRYLVGRLYFHTGSLHAIHRRDHREAISWYEKAYPLLSGDVPLGVLAQPRIHGEAFISMGVSYWKQSDRQRAIDLTEHGTDIMQQSVVDGLLDSSALTIPYGNLASMHKQVGNHTDAKAFAELAASVKAGKSIKR